MKNFSSIIQEWKDCSRCQIGEWAKHHVFGRTPHTKFKRGTVVPVVWADILFIGEGPGRAENARGLSFIGPAGKILDAAMPDSIRTGKVSAYITNVVACRPCDERTGPNRQPTTLEMVECWPRLEETIKVLRPAGIVLLGKVAQGFVARHRDYEGIYQDRLLNLSHPAWIGRMGGVRSSHFDDFRDRLSEFVERVVEWLEGLGGRRKRVSVRRRK